MSQELPATTVVGLNNLDDYVLVEGGLSSMTCVILTTPGPEESVPLLLPDLQGSTALAGNIVFANVQMRPWKITGAARWLSSPRHGRACQDAPDSLPMMPATPRGEGPLRER